MASYYLSVWAPERLNEGNELRERAVYKSITSNGGTMHTYHVTYYVQNVGTIEEQVRAGSEFNVRRLIAAKYPGVYVRVIQVSQVD